MEEMGACSKPSLKVNLVSIETITRITPSSNDSPHPSRLDLSNIDQILFNHELGLLFFFNNNTLHSQFMDPNLLKPALSKLLSEFYPFAGKLVPTGPRNRLHVECNDEGVEFTITKVECRLSDLLLESVQPDFSPLLPPKSAELKPWEGPIFRCQINSFECGGVVLAASANHSLVDLEGMLIFLSRWADLVRNRDDHANPIKAKSPIFDRTFLLPNDNPIRNSNLKHIDDPQTDHDIIQLKTVLLEITKERAEALKNEVKAQKPTLPATTFQCLVALLWRSVTRARKFDPSKEITLIMLVNCRKFFSIKPLTFCGNCFTEVRARMKAGEVAEGALWEVVEKIGEALGKADKEAAMSEVNWLESQDQTPFDSISIRSEGAADEFRVASLMFPLVYELDFGWGKPSAVKPLSQQNGVVVMFYAPPQKPAGIELVLTLPDEHMESVEKDEELSAHIHG
ncbi:rosmarinate synthase-like [Tasmannia lanceolata]|uniref:rosmarinate synthase-like n=1 Tax=Tasmannia lanceolata TaxID=3420 RepID=UPI004063FD29